MATDLDKRRGRLFYELFQIVSSYFIEFYFEMKYSIDSFPIAVFNNMRITNTKIVTNIKWWVYTGSVRNYFYGVKVKLVTTKDGIPTAFYFTPGKTGDAKSNRKNDL